jgi:hypothetical protein
MYKVKKLLTFCRQTQQYYIISLFTVVAACFGHSWPSSGQLVETKFTVSAYLIVPYISKRWPEDGQEWLKHVATIIYKLKTNLFLFMFDGKILTICLPYGFLSLMLAMFSDFNPRLIASLL